MWLENFTCLVAKNRPKPKHDISPAFRMIGYSHVNRPARGRDRSTAPENGVEIVSLCSIMDSKETIQSLYYPWQHPRRPPIHVSSTKLNCDLLCSLLHWQILLQAVAVLFSGLHRNILTIYISINHRPSSIRVLFNTARSTCCWTPGSVIELRDFYKNFTYVRFSFSLTLLTHRIKIPPSSF